MKKSLLPAAFRSRRSGVIALGLVLLLIAIITVAQVVRPSPRRELPLAHAAPSAAATGQSTDALSSAAPMAGETASADPAAEEPTPVAATQAADSRSPVRKEGASVAISAQREGLRATVHAAASPAVAWLDESPVPVQARAAAAILASTSGSAMAAAQAIAPATRAAAATGVVTAGSVFGITPASGLPVRAAVVAPAVSSAHPRLILDAATLAALRQNAAANTAEWQLLKAACDSYIGGTVNYPAQAPYPNLPDLGQGYQGDVYFPALMNSALCYQVLKSANPTAAAPYGAKAVDLLMKMAAPFTTGSGNLGQDPMTDDGYGIRFYGVGYGLGYDWLYDLLTPAQRTQIYTTANAWLTAFEDPNGKAAFAYGYPQGNYYAGYYHAKVVIALATYGDNPSAPVEWSDWYNNQFTARVQPYYARHLLGGGWPEGFGNYGPKGILNMSFPMREVKTATGQDLIYSSLSFSYPLASADYAMHFTWPSRDYFDDRDTNHEISTAQPAGTTQTGMFVQILGELSYWKSPEASVFRQYLNEVTAATSNFGAADPWLLFLETDPGATTTSVSTLPLSYFAAGMNAVAARSDWTNGASWMSFRAGPYVNNPNAAEEGFDQGSLALVHGSVPLLLNATGWLVHNPNGASDETLQYQDQFGNFNGSIYSGNRQIYNIYYVRNINGSTVAEPYGQGGYTTELNQVRTQVSAYEDGGDYVYILATHLEDMYRPFAAGPGVAAWSRQVVYLRPNRFVVYDRTSEGSATYDQYMAWHFPANPVVGNAATGQRRLDVTYNGQYAGAMTTVLPLNATTTTVAQYPGSNPVKVWQVQVRPNNTSLNQQWLTVFDLSSSAAAVASARPVTITQGAAVGVALSASDGNSVVISSAGAAGVPISGAVAYAVPAVAAQHLLTELVPATGYTISVTTAGSTQTVSVTPGGTSMSSGRGVLDFHVSAAGAVQLGKPVISTLPVNTLPVNGSPRSYPP